MQLILPYIFRCDCPDCKEWLDKDYLMMSWFGGVFYYSHIRCKRVHRSMLHAKLNLGDERW